MKVSDRIEALDLEISIVEDEIEDLESRGFFFGKQYDDFMDELRDLQGERNHLETLDDDTEC